MRPGARDLFVNLIKVATPNNYYACHFGLAAGVCQFHGQRLRALTGGQCPVVVYKSSKKGKSEGKSGVARMTCYLVSDWKTNKLSPKLSNETIRKKMSYTACPLYFDDVKKDSFINRVTEGFDDGEVYETAEGIFPKRAELFFSANYFAMDESSSSDSERICDRLCVIPFREWGFMPASEFSKRQSRFKSVVDNEQRPTELVIGEMGDFLVSEEFMEKRQYFAQWLYDKAEVVKMRTLLTNYASFYAFNWKLHNIFESEWTKMGYSWPGFMEWAENFHVPFIVSQHVEKDHAVHSIRRYVNGILEFASGMIETDVLKFMRICNTKKTRDKFVLALHPDKRYQGLTEFGNVKIFDIKKHLPTVGGLWDETTYASFVKAGIEDLDDSKDAKANLIAKRALLIPMSCFTSAQKMKICDLTGQKEFYSLADNETPSGVEDIANSTSRSGAPSRLALNDLSSINIPATEESASAEQEVGREDTFNEIPIVNNVADFDNLEEISGDNLSENESNGSNDLLETKNESDETDESHESNESNESDTANEFKCSICHSSFESLSILIKHMKSHGKGRKKSRKSAIVLDCRECSFKSNYANKLREHIALQHTEKELEVQDQVSTTEQSLSKTMNSNPNRTISRIENSFVCECGFSSTSKSGASRHKCRTTKLQFKCDFCEKVCGNSGSLKQHIKSKHMDKQKHGNNSCSEKNSVPVVEKSDSAQNVSETEVNDAIEVASQVTNEQAPRIMPNVPTSEANAIAAMPLRRSSRRKSVGNHKKKSSAAKSK